MSSPHRFKKKVVVRAIGVALCVALGVGGLVWRVLYWPRLTRNSAARVLHDGMQESQVFDLLGTNAIISDETNGLRYLHYFFTFTGKPPKLKTDLENITIVLSNGVVIDRKFWER